MPASVVFGTQRTANGYQRFPHPATSRPPFETRISSLGYGHRLGFYGQYLGITSNSDGIAFGITASLPVDMGGKREVSTVTGNTLTVVEGEDEGPQGNLLLPMELNTGLTVYFQTAMPCSPVKS